MKDILDLFKLVCKEGFSELHLFEQESYLEPRSARGVIDQAPKVDYSKKIIRILQYFKAIERPEEKLKRIDGWWWIGPDTGGGVIEPQKDKSKGTWQKGPQIHLAIRLHLIAAGFPFQNTLQVPLSSLGLTKIFLELAL